MLSRRTILAFLLALTLAFQPTVNMAMASSCGTLNQMAGGQALTAKASQVQASTVTLADVSNNCPCEKSMPDCASMPQCGTAAGCSSQCLGSPGVVAAAVHQAKSVHDRYTMGGNQLIVSLAIAPPSPPPRA